MPAELLAQAKRAARVRYDDVPRPTRALPSTARLLAWTRLPSIIPVVLPPKPSLLNAAPQAVPPMASEVEPPHSASKVLPGKTPSNPKTGVRRELPMTRVRRIHLDSVHRQGHLAIAVTSLAKTIRRFIHADVLHLLRPAGPRRSVPRATTTQRRSSIRALRIERMIAILHGI
jgi:hypothetical protein